MRKFSLNFKNKKVLIVDDVSRTGATLEKAKEIIELVLNNGTSGEAIQYLLNRRMSDLPSVNRPHYEDGDNKCIAFWVKKDGLVSDRIKDLLNLDGEPSGKWCDLKGKSVKLLDK